MPLSGPKPDWLTFDCYGTLIQWDEGLLRAVQEILGRHNSSDINADTLINIYDTHEHKLKQKKPHQPFRIVAGTALKMAMEELGLPFTSEDIETLTSGISKMPPFPEVITSLKSLKEMDFKICIISNTDDDIIAGNVDQMGGYIDRVITAEQAQAYKPSPKIFDHAHSALSVTKDDIVHICASPHLDLAAARDMGFRCIWINRGTGRKPLPDYTPDEEFATLDKLSELFSSLGWNM